MTDEDVRDYFRDLYELGADSSATLDDKIQRAITVGRDRLGVDYGVLSYTGGGDYEVIGSTIASRDYTTGSVHDLDTTWCRHVVGDRELLMIRDAAHARTDRGHPPRRTSHETTRIVDWDVKNVHEELGRLVRLDIVYVEEDGQRKRPVIWFAARSVCSARFRDSGGFQIALDRPMDPDHSSMSSY